MSESGEAVEGAEKRLQQIMSVIDPELTSLEFEPFLHELVDRTQRLLRVDTVTVLVCDERYRHLVTTHAVGGAAEKRRGSRVPLGTGFAGTVASRRAPCALEHDSAEIEPVTYERDLGSLFGLPMLAGGKLIGVLHVGVFTPRRFTAHERYLLQLVADRIAVRAPADVSRMERAAAVALGRSFQPNRFPVLREVTFAARYVPGHGTVGGDWYDVFTLPTGKIGIVIGDVAGSGLSAAAVMGRLRSALRAYALETDDPARVLDKLDRKATHFETRTMTTVAYAVFDPAANQLHLSLAGHPAPVRALPTQPAALVDSVVDPPLGFGLAESRRTTRLDVPTGAVVCLYTDGLVERSDSTLDAGEDRLCRAVSADSAESVCTTVMDTLLGEHSVEDDVALLTVSRQAPAEVLPTAAASDVRGETSVRE